MSKKKLLNCYIVKLLKVQSGQTLLEVMVALGAATLIMSAIVAVVISSLSNEQFGINQNQATQFAQEGLDVLRNTSQSNWGTFSGYSNYYCLPQGGVVPTPLPAGQSCPQNVGIFVRELRVEQNVCGVTPTPAVPNNGRVTSTVKWSDGKCPSVSQFWHKVSLTSCFFKPITPVYP